MRRYRRLVALLIAVAALPGALAAQARGTVSGRIVDAATGQPLAAASVVIR